MRAISKPVRLKWYDEAKVSRLYEHACLWLDYDGKWCSNTPPLSGSWATREEGKAALVTALRQHYEGLLASLPEVGA